MKKILVIITAITFLFTNFANASQVEAVGTEPLSNMAKNASDNDANYKLKSGPKYSEFTKTTQILSKINKPEQKVSEVKIKYKLLKQDQKIAEVAAVSNGCDCNNSKQIVEDGVKGDGKGVIVNEPVLTEENNQAKEGNNQSQQVDLKPSLVEDHQAKVEDHQVKKEQERIKTEGHYVGFDMIVNRLSWYEKYSQSGYEIYEQTSTKPSSSGYGGGIGTDYKYAFNFNNWFIAPGVFYEKFNTDANPSHEAYNDCRSQVTNLSARSRYGFLADIGYDVSNTFSPYFLGGYGVISYSATNGLCKDDLRTQSANYRPNIGGFIYGAGMKINYDRKLSFKVEFNNQFSKIPTRTDVQFNDSNYTSTFYSHLRSLKLGVSYNF